MTPVLFIGEWGNVGKQRIFQDFPQNSLLGEDIAFRILDFTFQTSERARHPSLAHG